MQPQLAIEPKRVAEWTALKQSAGWKDPTVAKNLYLRVVGNLIESRPNLNRSRGKCLKMQDIRHLTQYLSGR